MGIEFMKLKAVQTNRYEARAILNMKVEVACERYLTTYICQLWLGHGSRAIGLALKTTALEGPRAIVAK